MTASKSGWTPLFFKAVPSKTGVNCRFIQERRMAAIKSASVGTFSSVILKLSKLNNKTNKTLLQ